MHSLTWTIHSLHWFWKYCWSWSLVSPLVFEKVLRLWLRTNKDSSWEEFDKCQNIVFYHMKAWHLLAQTKVFYHWYPQILHRIKFDTYMCGTFWSICYCEILPTINQDWNTKQRRGVHACFSGEHLERPKRELTQRGSDEDKQK